MRSLLSALPYAAIVLIVVGTATFVAAEVAYLRDPCIFRGDQQPPVGPGGIEECRTSEETYEYQSNHRSVASRVLVLGGIMAVVGVAVGLLLYGLRVEKPRVVLWGATVAILSFSPLAAVGSWSAVPLLIGILLLLGIGVARARALVRMRRGGQ